MSDSPATRFSKLFSNVMLKYRLYYRPTMINFAVTERCNSRCLTCDVWKTGGKSFKQELDLAQITGIFRRNRDFLKDVTFIQITGGDPFLRDDIVEIICEIHKVLPACQFWIATNGLLPEVVASQIKALYDRCHDLSIGVGVSVDGPQECHDLIRGVDGAYQKSIETVTALTSLKEQIPRLSVALSYTISKYNIHETDHIVSLAKELGADISFRPAHISPIYYGNIAAALAPTNLTLYDIKSSLGALREYLYQRSFFKRLPHLYFLDGTVDFIHNINSRRLPCYALYSSFFLNAFGEIYPCIMMDEKIGNLRTSKLSDIWLSSDAKVARSKIKKLNCPKCWIECETYRDMYADLVQLTKFAFKEIPRKKGI